ncbi:MAG: hypothetical protein AAGF95_30535 [Chloroflexota bacterium]
MHMFQPTTRQPRQQVLPKIQVTQSPEGLVLKEPLGGYTMLLFLGFFALFWNTITWVVFGTAWATQGLGSIWWGVIFVLVGLVLLFFFVRQLAISLRFGPGKLIISTWPLCIGSEAEVRFVRNIRGSATIERLEARLVCTEVATYQVGTDTRTVRETVWEETLPAAMMMPGSSMMDATWHVHIPKDAPPSLSVRRNQIVWSVEVKAYVANFPDTTSSFTLVVRPEVV